MTVHGAKGLEAPVVFLADTTTSPSDTQRLRLVRPARDLQSRERPGAVVWAGRKADDPCCVAKAREAMLAETEDEYRRLLYVAMTRARDDLHLVVPQRFFTHGQNAQGDRHVYAARTRFIPDELLGLFEGVAWPDAEPELAPRGASKGVRVDIAARMRGMWR